VLGEGEKAGTGPASQDNRKNLIHENDPVERLAKVGAKFPM
jgi:hypothetical protein